MHDDSDGKCILRRPAASLKPDHPLYDLTTPFVHMPSHLGHSEDCHTSRLQHHEDETSPSHDVESVPLPPHSPLRSTKEQLDAHISHRRTSSGWYGLSASTVQAFWDRLNGRDRRRRGQSIPDWQESAINIVKSTRESVRLSENVAELKRRSVEYTCAFHSPCMGITFSWIMGSHDHFRM